MEIFLSPPPRGLEEAFAELFTSDATKFIADLVRAFKVQVERLYAERRRRGEEVQSGRWLPPLSDIVPPPLEQPAWRVNEVPLALRDRRLDLGDVSPTNLKHFTYALCTDVQGIQVDFDDGHCPTWRNGLQGHQHVLHAVHNQLPHVPRIENAPVIMLRPRAWNMTEHNMVVDGEAVPGPIFDFGLHMFHNAKKLFAVSRGPFFYLSKVESAAEASLWDAIFEWSEERLLLPVGSVKACVLIEDILAAFEMDGILHALRRHSAGLNCGIWDYCASIVARFGTHPSFLLPDRNKYVSMDKPFLKKYMSLAVQIAERRGTCATGGMAALMVDSEYNINKVVDAKRKEIEAGVAGFMVYDVRLIPAIKKLWAEFGNQPVKHAAPEPITFQSLLEMPAGGVTHEGLEHNIRVALLFICHWTEGRGHFVHQGAVEDSATAEISRWQVRQWLTHQTKIEGTQETVTFCHVLRLVSTISQDLHLRPFIATVYLRLLTLKPPPQFITTFLSDFILLPKKPQTASSHL